MKTRLNYYQASPDTINALSQIGEHLQSAFPDHRLKALVELRVSQVNGCAYCIDLHSNQARELGETQQRLDCLPVWREVNFFDPREQAALAWAESVTLVSETHVPEEVFQTLTQHFSSQEIVQLTVVIGMMNAWNRISISFRNAPAKRTAT